MWLAVPCSDGRWACVTSAEVGMSRAGLDGGGSYCSLLVWAGVTGGSGMASLLVMTVPSADCDDCSRTGLPRDGSHWCDVDGCSWLPGSFDGDHDRTRLSVMGFLGDTRALYGGGWAE